MSYDLLFSAVNASVIPAWALLILAPKWSVTDKLVHSMFYPMLLGGVYIAGMILAYMGDGAEGGSFTSIEGVRTLFSADVGMVIGWTHFLVFDLFVGAWEASDARGRRYRQRVLMPCLMLTFMRGRNLFAL